MPTPHDSAHDFRKPTATAAAVFDDLHSQWAGLSETARAELGGILTAWSVRLMQVDGDIARGATLTPLLNELERAATLPASTAAMLSAAHRPPSRSVELLSSDQARALKASVDRLIGPDDSLAAADAAPASDEIFPEAARVARRVITRLNDRWAELSLQDQERVFDWMSRYGAALEGAVDDIERLTVTHDFLRLVKGAPTVYAVTESAFSARGGGAPSFGGPGQAMSAQDGGQIVQLIESNPMAALPKTPLSGVSSDFAESLPPLAEINFSLAESAPPAFDLLATAGMAPPIELGREVVDASPQRVDFHTDVRFPGQVRTFDRDIPLRVRLTLERAEGSVVDAGVAVEFVTPEPQPVLVVCNAEGFSEESDDLTRTIMVYMDRDSQPAIFLLTPDPTQGPGTRRISLDFYHRQRLAGTASFQVEVRDRPPIDETPAEPEPVIADRAEDGTLTGSEAGTLTLASDDAARPDFVLRITLSNDRRQLSYTLHSPTGKLGLVFQRMGSMTLQSDPRTFLENTLLGLSQMARASRKKLTDAQIAANQEKLREIGWDLYEQLFSPALRRAYRRLRDLAQQEPNLSLLIVSDEPWIPWEMVLPHEDDLPNEDFLCAQFRLTRWLDGRGLPEDLSVHQARVVAPKSNLASVKAEQDFFRQDLPKLRPEISYGGAWLDMASQVTDALRGGDVQLFHFACHGDFDYTRPDESALMLQGDSLRPSQIVGPMRTGVAHSKPLVFLNACHTGESGFSLTGMGGWAARFVRAGASAFVGSLWEVNDELAAAFAIRFYTDLLQGASLGDAFHAARAQIRAQDPANPTWLAYTLYADPNGRVKSDDPS